MPLHQQSKDPNRRRCVVKMRSDAQRDAPAGRLENLVAGGQRGFASGRALRATVARDLAGGTEPHIGEKP